MALTGSGVKISNFQLRFFVLVFFGIAAISSVLYWREKTLAVASYADFPTHPNNTSALRSELRSQNYQIDVEDASPTAK